MGKLAFALVIVARKLKPYFQAHTIVVLTDKPLRRAMGSPDAVGRMALPEFCLEEHHLQIWEYLGCLSQIMERNLTTTHSETSIWNQESRTTTCHMPTHKPMDNSKLRTDPCSKSSRLGSRGQRAYDRMNYQVFYRHTGQQGRPQGRCHFDQYTEARQSSQQKQGSQATRQRTLMRVRMMKLYACNLTWWTRSGQQPSKVWHDTRTLW